MRRASPMVLGIILGLILFLVIRLFVMPHDLTGWSIRYPNGDIETSIAKPRFDASRYICTDHPYDRRDTTVTRDLLQSCTSTTDGTRIEEWRITGAPGDTL